MVSAHPLHALFDLLLHFLPVVYSDGSEMIPRNTSVVIRRIPIANAPKLPKTQ